MLVHKYMMKAISNIVAAVSSFIALMVMTRYVSYEYGVMMWGFAFASLLNTVTALGFETAHIKFMAEGKNQNDCFSTYAVIKSSLTVVMVIMAVAALYTGIVDKNIDPSATRVITLFVIYAVFVNLKTIITFTFDARLESGKSSITLMIESVSRSAILIVLALMHVSADTLSTAYVVGIVLTLVISIILCRNMNLKFVRPTMFREYASFTAPLVISSVILLVMESLDRVVIGFNGNPYEVGYYAAAMGAVVAVVALGASMNNVILPQLSSPEMTCSRTKTEGLVWISQKYLMMILLPVTAVLIIYGEAIATVLFGAGYSRAGLILSILSIMMTMKVLSGVLAQVLYASNNTRLFTRASVIYGTIVIVLYFLFIPNSSIFPWSGGVGAALAITTGSVINIILLFYYVKKSTGVGIYTHLWKHIVSTVLTLLVLVIISCSFDISGFIPVAIVSVLGVSVYMLILGVMGEFTKGDIRFFRNALSPKQLMKSLEDELN